MGNLLEISSYADYEDENENAITGFSFYELDIIKQTFMEMVTPEGNLDKEEFKEWLCLEDKRMKFVNKIFEFFDVDNDGQVSYYEFLCGITTLNQSKMDTKADFFIDLFFDGKDQIDLDKLIGLTEFCVNIVNSYIEGKEPAEDDEIEKIAKKLLDNYDKIKIPEGSKTRKNYLSIVEFKNLFLNEMLIIKSLFALGLISKKGGGDEIAEWDTFLEDEMLKAEADKDERIEKIKNGVEIVLPEEDESGEKPAQNKKQKQLEAEWMVAEAKNKPDNLKQMSGFDITIPQVNLELDFVYGFRSFDTRNNLKYTPDKEILYIVASIAVIFNPKTRKQRFFMDHNDDICCMDIHYESKIVCTGQLGSTPIICLWNINTMQTLIVFQGILTNGIGNLCISSDGRLLAAVGLDEMHTAVVYNIKQVEEARKKSINDPYVGVVAKGTNSRSPVWDLQFSDDDKFIICGMQNEVGFFSYYGGQLRKSKGVWDYQTTPQSALVVGKMDGFVITGMFKGQLIVWRYESDLQSWIQQSIQKGHSGPVISMDTMSSQKGIISGGNDGDIILWSFQNKILATIRKYEIREVQKVLDLQVIKISALYEDADGNILFGTRGSEIVQIDSSVKDEKGIKPENVVMRGHFFGQVNGLCMNPKENIFYTIGQDSILASWDMINKKYIQIFQTGKPSDCIDTSNDGKYLAVGNLYGELFVYNTDDLKLEGKDSQPISLIDDDFGDQRSIKYVKFLPNSDILSVCYEHENNTLIEFFQSGTWQKQEQKIPVQNQVVCIDFSKDGKYLRLNKVFEGNNDDPDNPIPSKLLLQYYSYEKRSILEDNNIIKKLEWSTQNCPASFQTIGIWPPCSQGVDVCSCDLAKNCNILASGDEFSKLKLFKYPSAQQGASYVRYNGHAANIVKIAITNINVFNIKSKVRFSFDEKYLISTGGADLSIFQWKFIYDKDGAEQQKKNYQQVIKQEIVQDNFSEIIKVDKLAAKNNLAQQYKFLKPDYHKLNQAKDNRVAQGDLELNWAFGFRTIFKENVDDCRNMCAILSNGHIAFTTAGVGVIYDINNQTQSFFQEHTDDITAFAKHPFLDILATGQMSEQQGANLMDIYVWDTKTKNILTHIKDFHLFSVVSLSFSPNGLFLLSAGGDIDNSIAIHDWMGARMITNSKVDKEKVNGVAWSTNSSFVTIGQKHVRFWEINGKNMQSNEGLFAGGNFVQQKCVACTDDGKSTITGCKEGNLYLWNNFKSSQPVNAHQGSVGTLLSIPKQRFFSGGYDGKVILWNVNGGSKINQEEIFEDIVKLQQLQKYQYNPAIVSLYFQNDTLLIGNKSSELYLGKKKDLKPILHGHFEGEVWGAASSYNDDVFCTSGGDKTIRVWDLQKKQMMIGSKIFKKEIRAIDWSQSGKFIVAGDQDGSIYTINPKDLSIISECQSSFSKLQSVKFKWIQDLKISPDNKQLAFGVHNVKSYIEIYNIDDQGKIVPNNSIIIKPEFESGLTHLDWSKDGKYIVANSQSFEMKVYDLTKQTSVTIDKDCDKAIKDIQWFTNTCTLGWGVQGINETDILGEVLCSTRSNGLHYASGDYSKGEYALARKKYEEEFKARGETIPEQSFNKNNGYIIATGDNAGAINLFRWPVCVRQQVNKTFFGHSANVQNLKFSKDDSYLVSVGGNDKTVFVWKTTFGGSNFQFEEEEFSEIQVGKGKVKKHKAEKEKQKKEVDPDTIFEEEDLEKGDEFGACKPWLGAIKEPTDFKPDPKKNDPPKVKPKIEYVFGVRSKDTRNNVRYTKSGKIVYHMAGLGIVLDQKDNTQTFFEKHTDDITAMDVNSTLDYAATGEVGPKPFIYVWHIDSKEIKCKFNAPLQKGITCLAFNKDGTKLAAVSINQGEQFPYAVFDVAKGTVICSDKSGPDFILSLCWGTNDEFATSGPKHFYIWKVEGAKCSKQKGSYGSSKASVVLGPVAAYGGDYIAGGTDGWFEVFKGGKIDDKASFKHHIGIVESVGQANDFCMSGGQDGKINIYNKQYQIVSTIKTKIKDEGQITCELQQKLAKSIRSITLSKDNKTILISTYGSQIHELTNSGATIDNSSKWENEQIRMTGHYTPVQKWTNEIWGLDVMKSDSDKFVTCGDDGTLRMYSIKDRKQIAVIETTLDAKKKPEKLEKGTGDPSESTRGRCVAASKKGEHFIVGMKEGTCKVYSQKNGKFEQTKNFKKSKKWIQEVAFSADDSQVAIGAHDQCIYLFSCKGKDWKPKGKGPLKKHSSSILHFDFSEDGNALHSNCQAYELLFWDLKACKQDPKGATVYKDEQWHTWTCILGFPVQGIFPECATGTDINYCARSNDKKYVCTSDDFSTLKIFNYPCIKKGAGFTEGKGHSSHVTCCKWSNDDKRIFTSGGEDQAIIMWKVV